MLSDRLDLVAASAETIRAALDDRRRLGAALGAEVPSIWPPELLDANALTWSLGWLSDPKNDPGYGFYWLLVRNGAADARQQTAHTLIGIAGFKGMPEDGVVEVGYGVVAEYQRRGYATEAVRALLAHAFACPGVTRVIAETLPGLAASIGVLEKCGFRFIGAGSEPDTIRYECTPRV
jgi:[ribosomal protein S5]-alanine N-acetyltransferase